MFSPKSPRSVRFSPRAMGRWPRLPMATADASGCCSSSCRRGVSSAVRKMRGSTAHSSVSPQSSSGASRSSSSTGTYTAAGFSASSAAVTCSAFCTEQVKRIACPPSGASGRGRAGSFRRGGMSIRRFASSSSSSRRRPLTALAGIVSPSSSSISIRSAVNTVPPVLLSRCRSSSAVTARFRASSGTAPSTAKAAPPWTAQAPLSRTGSPRRTDRRRFTGIFLLSRPFSYISRAFANSSFGSGAFSGRVPNIWGPFLPSQ